MLTDVPGFQRQPRASGEVLRGWHCCGIRLATTLLGLLASSVVLTTALVPGRSARPISIRRPERISLIGSRFLAITWRLLPGSDSGLATVEHCDRAVIHRAHRYRDVAACSAASFGFIVAHELEHCSLALLTDAGVVFHGPCGHEPGRLRTLQQAQAIIAASA